MDLSVGRHATAVRRLRWLRAKLGQRLEKAVARHGTHVHLQSEFENDCLGKPRPKGRLEWLHAAGNRGRRERSGLGRRVGQIQLWLRPPAERLVRFQKVALVELRKAAEQFMTGRFEEANILASHRGSQTVSRQDFSTMRRLGLL